MSKKTTNFGVGSSSIIMIFIVLCLTTFSLLSYSSARTSLKFATKAKEYAEAFNAAELKANRTLAEIDKQLFQAHSSKNYGNDVLALSSIEGVSTATDTDSYIISYSSTITSSTYFQFELRVPLTPSKERYHIVKWNTFSIEHDYNNGENIWDGTF